MYRTVKFLSISLITIIIAIASAYADESGGGRNRAYGFLMLEEPVNPRSIAMGSAGAALGGSGFRYYNPARPFFSAQSHAAAEFGQMPGGVNRGGFEAAITLPEWFAAIGFYSNFVDFETRDEHGFGVTASSGTTTGELSVGYIRDEKLSLGVSVNVTEDRVWVSSSYSAVALSAGLGYKALDGKLSLGAAWINGAAWSKGFGDDPAAWNSGRVPVFARAGAAWTDTFKSFPFTAAADIAYSDEDGKYTVPVGIDVKALPYINLRVGKRFGWENEVMSFGIGINIDRLSFDAAFVPTVFVDEYEMKWSMGFTYSLGVRRKEKKTEIMMPSISITPEADETDESDDEETAAETEKMMTIEETTEAEEDVDESTEPSTTDTEEPLDTEKPTEPTEPTDTKEETPALEESSMTEKPTKTEPTESTDTKDESPSTEESSGTEKPTESTDTKEESANPTEPQKAEE